MLRYLWPLAIALVPVLPAQESAAAAPAESAASAEQNPEDQQPGTEGLPSTDGVQVGAGTSGVEEPAKLDTSKLQIMLEPLTKDELGVEADGWKGLLHTLAEEVAKRKLQQTDSSLSTEQRDAITAALVELRTRRSNIVDRLEIVLKAWIAKGATEDDAAPYRAYASAVSDSGLSNISTDDVGAATNQIWITVKDWAISADGGLKWLRRILLAITVYIIFGIIGRILSGVIKKALGRMKSTSALLKDFFINTTRKAIWFIGLVVALSQLGIDLTPLVAAIGGAAFVIGFALQGTLSNFAAGVMILLYRPFDIGAFVEVGGVSGTVSAMSLVSTTLNTPDNKMVVIPNGSIWGDIITNYSGNPTRRVDLVFGIAYSDDMAKAESILREVVGAHEKVLKTPETVIKVHELADSSVNFVCRPWVNTADYWGVYWDLTRKVKEEFDAQEISIPFPQRDLHLFSDGKPLENKPGEAATA